MSIEDIFRVAKKANVMPDKPATPDKSEQWKDDYYMSLAETDPPSFSSPNSSATEQNKPQWQCDSGVSA